MTIDRMDVILNGNSSGAHTALNQTVSDLENLKAKIIQINNEFKGMQTNLATIKSLLGSLAGTSGNVTNNIVNNNQRIDNSIHNTTNNVNNLGNSVNRTATRVNSGIASMLKSFMGLYAVGKAFSFVKQSMITGMDTIESESLFETSLDNMSDKARKWSEDLSLQLGLNAVELRKNIGILYTMTTSMGIADDTAYEVSENLVKLANDMASYYNLTTEEAFVKIRAGLTGEIVPLKSIGILIDDETIKQYAYANGIAETGKALTQQQKVLARYTALMAQTGLAQGDLARTIESPANQLRMLKTRFEELKQTVGAEIQPVLKIVFPAIGNMIKSSTPYLVSGVRMIASLVKSISMISAPAMKAVVVSAIALTVLSNLSKIYGVYNGLKKTAMILAFGEAAANTMDVSATTASAIAHGLLNKVYNILIPQTIKFSSVLKASLGWIGLVAGAVALLYSIFWKKKKSVDDTSSSLENLNSKFSDISKYNVNLDNMSKQFEDTSGAVDDTSDSIEDLKKNVSLAGFDEINTLSFESESLVNLDTDDVDDYSDALDDLDSQINSMPTSLNFDMPELDEYDLASLFKLDGLEGVKEKFLDWVEETFGISARNKIDDFFYNIELIPDATSQMFDDMLSDGGIRNPDSKFWDNWIPEAEELEQKFEDLTGGEDGFGASWNDLWENFGEGVFNFKEGLKEMKDEWVRWFGEFGKSWSDFWEEKGTDFADWVENIKMHLDTIAKAIKAVFSGEVFEEDFSVAGFFGQIVAGESAKINGYASGGFPDYGELFIARENGIPEMVGTMGGSPAVANNTEIVEGISQGVYEAVTSAIQQNTSSGNNQKIIIPVYLFKGSSELTRIVADASMQYNAMTGGY